ncbi:DUF885 domain-containing protein [Actinomycetospora straminea]|uniref:DUF885 domain-containing protein n=1 Tax=Actinomycetospora straminea TaxID=663607 RepID=A0ABP9E3W7_9PSEU|nr:DUF885 domain-containing protein [Actinomycetospora straminea]MDD7930896.1 DUF885 domain-containing protein [Actinomycetospora straminea]
MVADPGPGGGLDGLARAYVDLALRLDRVLPGVLDAHFGDPAHAARVAAAPAPDPHDLVREADRLRAELAGATTGATAGPATDPATEAARVAFLDAQLRACRVLAERAAGRDVGFVDEVERCFDVRIARGDEDRYRAAHRDLDALLDGPGALPDRLAAFRDGDRLAAGHLRTALGAAVDALRERTAATVGLPPGEDVTLEVVDAAPWSGFSRWIGPRRSAVAVNGGIGHRVTHLPLLVAHEAYPGHHTEHCRTAADLADAAADGAGRRVRPEREVFLARTPQSLVAEGAAELGLEAVVGPGWGRWNAEVLGAAGVPTDPERGALGEAVEDVMARLAPVRQDAALMLHDEHRSPDEVVAHLCRWLLLDEPRARRMLEFLGHPRWRTHTTTYVEGARLLRPWLLGADGSRPAEVVTARLVRVLDAPPTPAELRAERRAELRADVAV